MSVSREAHAVIEQLIQELEAMAADCDVAGKLFRETCGEHQATKQDGFAVTLRRTVALLADVLGSQTPGTEKEGEGTRVDHTQYDQPLATAAINKPVPTKCPTCDSPSPHLHPAVQFEGEVEICRDAFHTRETPMNYRHLERGPDATADPTLRQLSTKWRARADQFNYTEDAAAYTELRRCADELDAEMSAAQDRKRRVSHSEIRCGEPDPKRRAWCVLAPGHFGRHQDAWGMKFPGLKPRE